AERTLELEDRTQRLADQLLEREEALQAREERLEALAFAHEQAQNELHLVRTDANSLPVELDGLSGAYGRAQEELAILSRDARGLHALLDGRRVRTSRVRTLSQLGSWVVHGRFGLIRRYVSVRRSGAVDALAYAARYPDVAVNGINPLMHYVE